MKERFIHLGRYLERVQMKSIVGAERTGEEPADCESSCLADRDCPQDRTCKSAVCASDPKKDYKACFRY
ncbi:MAG: hypothetical protein K2X37_06675 [Chitinophagaceae bacterium]|nr:hypothetical protein [Chitinophagaceae bacterium]